MAKINRHYIVAGESFMTKADVQARVTRILDDGPLPSKVAISDERFLRALLNTRSDKLGEIGSRTVVHFERDHQPGPVRHTRTIWVALDDGTRLDASLYNKAVRLLEPGVDPSVTRGLE